MAAGGTSSPGGQGDVCTAVGCYAGREVDVCHLTWVFVPDASWCPEEFFGNSEFSSFRCCLLEEMCFTPRWISSVHPSGSLSVSRKVLQWAFWEPPVALRRRIPHALPSQNTAHVGGEDWD